MLPARHDDDDFDLKSCLFSIWPFHIIKFKNFLRLYMDISLH